MNAIPCISIIIPTYNQGHLIGDCIESIRCQTVSNWEALVINNFSDDSTEEVVANFQDSRIRIIRFRNYGVIASSRNEGVKLARAPYVAFLDSDDIWYPTKIEKTITAIQTGHELVCHANSCIRPDGSIANVIGRSPAHGATYYQLLFGDNCLSTSGVTMSVRLFNAVGGFSEKPEYITAEDYDLWLNVARSGTSIYFIDNILGEYRLHSGNLSYVAERSHQAITEVLKFHFSTNFQFTIINRLRIRKRFGYASYCCVRRLQDNKQFTPAYKWLIYSIYLWPFAPKIWAALIYNIIESAWPVNKCKLV